MSLPTYPFARERYWMETSGHKRLPGAVLHPLLHRNTSDLIEQRYSSVFAGDEFFLADYPVQGNGREGEKILPGVACLEMARAAVMESLPAPRESAILELRNIVWAQPIEIGQSTQINVALLPDHKSQVEFEIYSLDESQTVIHCQGRAAWCDQEAYAKLSIEQLSQQMSHGRLGADGVYAASARMGLNYGPSFHAIAELYSESNQVFAPLRLPNTLAEKATDYVLHPSLMEGGLQAAVALIDASRGPSSSPPRFCALESLRILSPCTRQMLAWVRYAPGTQAGDKTTKLDMDLSDEHGNLCLQMRGLSWRLTSQDRQYEIEMPAPAVQPAETRAIEVDVLSAVTTTLKTLLANELQMRESDIGENVQFVDLGLDSITGVTWVRKINQKYQTAIEAIKLYSYSTLAQLSRYVKEEAEKSGSLLGEEIAVVTGAAVSSRNGAVPQQNMPAKLHSLRKGSRFTGGPVRNSLHSIAVIGMAGQFPQAKNLEEFWENIAQARDCISPVPSERWDVSAYYEPGQISAGRTNCKWLGALEEYDRFDPRFFSISPKEAESMDPQQRLLLEACWHTIENAGYRASFLSGKKCGVFVGCTASDYALLSPQQRLSAQGFTGNAISIMAGRISYFLDLQGPCLSIDTACSSSLVAMANACDSLQSGDSDLALAGGVYVMTGPEMHIKTAQAGMLSPEGKCFTFDQRADGFVPGEGVGVVLLKRLEEAERDQDIIYGVIEGWGVNQDGKSNGITAPNVESQTRLEQEVYEKYQIDPGNIQLVEAHGTGTKLGDPIELEGLKKAFEKYTQNREYCALGSVKSNIGHCLTAAGIAGFLKLMLALQHKQLPPTINFERLNEHIELKGSPFYISEHLQEWKLNGDERRRAAINSLGFSGTNAHIVVAEYAPPASPKLSPTAVTQNGSIIVPLSAKNQEQLKEKARDLRDFIHRPDRVADLLEIAYTLQLGREAMEERVGFLVGSVEQLAEKLELYAKGEQAIPGVYQGQVKRSKESLKIISQDDEVKAMIVDKWIAQRKLSKLLGLWVQGVELDWNKLYREAKPQRICLPLYPFARERHWIKSGADDVANAAAANVVHPLLHHNISDLSETRFSTMFTGEEFFLADHRVKANGHAEKWLPGVAYLEMARAAIQQAAPMQMKSSTLELQNILWLKPAIVAERKQVSIALFVNDRDENSFEIYSSDDVQDTIHCQGQAVFTQPASPARVDIDLLKRQTEQKRLEASDVYAILAQMGLIYGPAHQGITSLCLGEKQVLAHLHLPSMFETRQSEYVLHPSLMDSALQASIGLILNVNHAPGRPYVPFALESLRALFPCPSEMAAWLRYAKGSGPEGDTIKLDIDLCDRQGNTCVQMRGLASRALKDEPKPARQDLTDHATHAKSNGRRNGSSFDSAFYQKLIADVLNREVSVDEATELA
jgi:acyl transferase domain-containing protein